MVGHAPFLPAGPKYFRRSRRHPPLVRTDCKKNFQQISFRFPTIANNSKTIQDRCRSNITRIANQEMTHGIRPLCYIDSYSFLKKYTLSMGFFGTFCTPRPRHPPHPLLRQNTSHFRPGIFPQKYPLLPIFAYLGIIMPNLHRP